MWKVKQIVSTENENMMKQLLKTFLSVSVRTEEDTIITN